MDAPSSPDRRAAFLAGLFFLAAYLAWLVWGQVDSQERVWVGGLTLLFTGLLAATAAFWMRRRTPNSRLHQAWSWWAAGLSLWVANDLVRLILQATGSSQMPDLLMDVTYLAGTAAVWVGLTRLPRTPRPAFGRLGLLFDVIITSAAVFSLAWVLVLRDAFTGSAHPAAGLYPLFDLGSLLLLLNLFLQSDSDHLPAPFGWISLGFLAYTLGDLSYLALVQTGSYRIASPADLGWVVGDLLVVTAALASAIPTARPAPRWFSRLLARLQSYLPLIATLLLGWLALLSWQVYGRLETFSLWMTVVLSLGLVARQGVRAGEVELQRYASLVNSVAEPAFVCDQRGILRLVNPALLQTAGFKLPQELLGQPLQRLLSADDITTPILAAGLTTGWSGELFLHRQDGSKIPISLSLRPLQHSGDRNLALAGTAHDLSLQKQQQAELQAANEQITADRAELARLNASLEQKVAEKTASLSEAYARLEEQNRALQELDKLKSDFVSLVSHELRAPLTNINAGIELLLSGPYHLPPRPRQNIELVQAEIRRLARFVETILDLSALDAGRLPLYPAPLSLAGAVTSLRQQLSQQPGAARINWNIPADLPTLLADEQALNSVLFHLLDNAFKYAPESEIEISAEVQQGHAWISIADHGPGIPEDALPRLFDQFVRINPEDNQTVYGHGLGLYIVRRLVEAMDGQVSAANRPEGGACFRFSLPLAAVLDEPA